MPADPLPLRQWSTDAAAPARRLDYWVGAICEAFLEMECSSREAGVFEGRLVSLAADELAYNQVRATTQDVYRTPAGVARSRSHPFYLITQCRTGWYVRQAGALVQLRPGDAVLVDSAQRYELHFPQAVDCLSIQMPRAWVARWLARVDGAEPRVAARDRGWGRALSGLCLQLAEAPELAAGYPQQLLADQVGAMLAAAVEPTELAAQPRALELSGRAQALLRAQLDQPGLTAAHIAAQLGVSARTLHRAFAARQASFFGRLRALRLERAAELLGQPRLAGVSVAELGRRCGYTDPSHFARDFQKFWGEPPARWRRRRAGR